MAAHLNWFVAGAAGEGIKSTGLLFSKSLLRHGYHTFDYTEYPSLIRGGHNTYLVTASSQRVHSPDNYVDVLVALNANGLKLHANLLHQNSIVIFDGEDLKVDANTLNLPGTVVSVPFNRLAREAGGERVMANNVSLGASIALLGMDLAVLNTVIEDNFKGKGPEIVHTNQACAKAGYDFVVNQLLPKVKPPHIVVKQAPSDAYSLTGNDALALGLIAGGIKVYIAYPMTPSSSILHAMADWQQKANIFVKHAEDEIGVINMALGMSFAGVRAAVGTSGGGFCYMTEAVGFSGVAELPLVIIEAQRPGPALGMPTWTAQGDLLFTLYASQDEFPRVVLAPGDVDEAFALGALAPNVAEEFQLPVIVLTDKHLGESARSTAFTKTSFANTRFGFEKAPQLDETGYTKRYNPDSPSGVTPRTVPGQPNGYYLSNSYEHDVHGIASEEAPDRIAQMDKRMKKLEAIAPRIPPQFYNGSDNPQVTLIGFGSTKGVMLAAQEMLVESGIDAAVFNLSWIWPFPADQVLQRINQSKCPIVIEGNKTHQLAKLIRQETGFDIYHKRTKYDGRPFYPQELVEWVKQILTQ